MKHKLAKYVQVGDVVVTHAGHECEVVHVARVRNAENRREMLVEIAYSVMGNTKAMAAYFGLRDSVKVR